jgi:hypothetical protein
MEKMNYNEINNLCYDNATGESYTLSLKKMEIFQWDPNNTSNQKQQQAQANLEKN